jgi:NTP pyrophosphatase (non-canonical NTP hydrolase)
MTTRPLDHETVRFFLTRPEITEAPSITRSQFGHWNHPGVEWEKIDEYPVGPFFRAWGYELCVVRMRDEHDEESPLTVAYFEGDSFLPWVPEPPVGQGWVLVSIHDNEDGPVAWYVRPEPRYPLDILAERIAAWQATTFPTATPASTAEHLRREAIELAQAPSDASEMADVFHLLVAVANASGVDLAAAVAVKFAKNRARVWGTPDVHGVVEHVEVTP